MKVSPVKNTAPKGRCMEQLPKRWAHAHGTSVTNKEVTLNKSFSVSTKLAGQQDLRTTKRVGRKSRRTAVQMNINRR